MNSLEVIDSWYGINYTLHFSVMVEMTQVNAFQKTACPFCLLLRDGLSESEKEMKWRYPTNPLPYDPWSAAPTRHTKRSKG